MKHRLLQVNLFAFIFSLLVFTGCDTFKPAPIAEGSDPVVVNAERAQQSSLSIFQVVTKWEYDNRLSLPRDVSRAIDRYRIEFPPAWSESRRALQKYKDTAGTDPSAINSITAALLVVQDSLLQLKKDANPNEVAQVTNALSSLIASIKSFFPPQP